MSLFQGGGQVVQQNFLIYNVFIGGGGRGSKQIKPMYILYVYFVYYVYFGWLPLGKK